ncbi:MAG: VWA domain-containing protein [Bacteriovoracaceae bacterium]|nr:VWA domain-containing protein [Bacteriovoracaceae bacterium]
MSFLYWKYFPIFLLIFLLFIFFQMRRDRLYSKWIYKYWFLVRSIKNKISSILYYLAFFILLLACLDFRGEEQSIKGEIPDQKTIILIDASASMLTEDVSPNRYNKALLLAKHFVKRAVGHKIAIVVFSNIQKRVIPFTDDIDLLNSRIQALEKVDIRRNGSNIFNAIKESLIYFNVQETRNINGNLLIFTDFEDTSSTRGLRRGEIPNSLNVAVVGIGTLNGGLIPLRSQTGVLERHKRYKGKNVVSKLDEKALKRLGGNIKNFKYWVSQSLTLPTEEVINFFRSKFKKKLRNSEYKIRPVYAKYLVVPALLLIIISLIFKMSNTFTSTVIVTIYILSNLIYSTPLAAKDKYLTKKIEDYKQKMRNGMLDRSGRLKLAEYLLRNKKEKEALEIYEENISKKGKHTKQTLFNYGTALLASGEIKKAKDLYQSILDKLPKTKDKKDLALIDSIRKNVLLTLKSKLNKKDKKKKGKKKEKDKSDKGKKKGKGKGKKDKKKQSKGTAGKGQNNAQKPKEKKAQTLEMKESMMRLRKKLVKIPAVLKQILDDDKMIQRKKISTSLRRFQRTATKKDW